MSEQRRRCFYIGGCGCGQWIEQPTSYPPPNNARERNILSQRLRGAKLEDIGKEYGLTRERVRQIVREAKAHEFDARIIRSKPLGLRDTTHQQLRDVDVLACSRMADTLRALWPE